jgi:lysine 6-dehydrogenase
VNGVKVRPIDVTAKLLFPQWKLKPGEEEFTVMRIRVEGIEGDIVKRFQYDLLDRTDKATNTLSMTRTTGFTCTAAVGLILEDKFTRKGISPAEYLGEEPDHFSYIMDHLANRGVHYKVSNY